MIYNLVQYLRIQYPTEIFYANAREKISPSNQIPDRCILISEYGGSDNPQDRYQQRSIQILVRDVDTPKCRKLSFQIYDELHHRPGLVLPAVTVGGDTFPNVHVGNITAKALPQSIGKDESGRVEFSTNFTVYMMV